MRGLRIARRGDLGLELSSDECEVKISCTYLDCSISTKKCEPQLMELTVPSVRGFKKGYVVQVNGVKILHTGPIANPIELPSADVLAIPMGGFWYLNAFEACEIAKKGPWKVIVPLAYWVPGTGRPFDTENMIKDLCRGMIRVRASKFYTVNFDRTKKTLVLVSAR